jgi:hypothetical protein
METMTKYTQKALNDTAEDIALLNSEVSAETSRLCSN